MDLKETSKGLVILHCSIFRQLPGPSGQAEKLPVLFVPPANHFFQLQRWQDT